MRLNKAVITTAVFGMLFFSMPIASAVETTPEASSRIVTAGGSGLFFEFTLKNLPSDLTLDTANQYTLTSPDCSNDGFKPSCGTKTPNFRLCNMDNSLSAPTASIFCYYSAITSAYDGNLSVWNSGVLMGTTNAYFDNQFAIQPTNGTYFVTNVKVSTNNSPCLTTPNQCTYWLEYYNGNTTLSQSGYVPIMATGIYTSMLSSALWTPTTLNTGDGTNPNPSAPSSCSSLSNCLTWFVDTLSTDSSVIGQAQHIYSDFFQFKYDDTGTQISWKDVNPSYTNCGYNNIPNNITNDRLPNGLSMPYYNANGTVPPHGACCIGPVIKLPSISVPEELANDSIYMSQFPRSKFITPFNACSGDAAYISNTYVLPITSALIYISFAFFLAKMLFGIFNLDSSSGVAGSAGQPANAIKAYRKRKGK